ncbi:MAG: L-histidine N(alpha)-methyltransferase [Hyphomicrobiaceae bacterium]|nr:L-histidine N(alpha)-methyltransferase [Hyphomicrobiaceae bacterium]
MLKLKHRDDQRVQIAAGEEFLRAVTAGLSRRQKTLPCRYFYDDRGSALFEEITELPEYYPTRAEAEILNANAHAMVADVAEGAVLVEFGSGSSRKTELLLDCLPTLRAYVMIDVSAGALEGARQRLAQRYPALDVRPVVGDFSFPIALAPDLQPVPKVGFFPGSTIGNLTPPEAQRLLRLFRAVLAPGGRLIVGVDLKKDLKVLLPAYNDAAGVTAAFNLNLLERINRELGADFDLAAFSHEAIYNERDGRIEMHLVSLIEQDVRLGGMRFRFEAGETIHTENSYKYAVGQFRSLAASAGWRPGRVWSDAQDLFSVHELVSD